MIYTSLKYASNDVGGKNFICKLMAEEDVDESSSEVRFKEVLFIQELEFT